MRTLRKVTSADQLEYGKIVDARSGEPLVPVIAVDTRYLAIEGLAAIRMQGWANLLAVENTLSTERASFWSRSRQGLWVKGETSGDYLNVREQGAFTDCDSDCLLLDVAPLGPTCHTGTQSCFEIADE